MDTRRFPWWAQVPQDSLRVGSVRSYNHLCLALGTKKESEDPSGNYIYIWVQHPEDAVGDNNTNMCELCEILGNLSRRWLASKITASRIV